VRSAAECMELLHSKKINKISLDYNLGFWKPTGYEVVKYMVNHRLYPKKIIIHSANPFGRMKMFNLLSRHIPKNVSVSIQPLPLPLTHIFKPFESIGSIEHTKRP
jgi:hypothetical protein